jgi:hypothetical protein
MKAASSSPTFHRRGNPFFVNEMHGVAVAKQVDRSLPLGEHCFSQDRLQMCNSSKQEDQSVMCPNCDSQQHTATHPNFLVLSVVEGFCADVLHLGVQFRRRGGEGRGKSLQGSKRLEQAVVPQLTRLEPWVLVILHPKNPRLLHLLLQICQMFCISTLAKQPASRYRHGRD